MNEKVLIPRKLVIGRLRRAGCTFQRRADRVEIWRLRGSAQRVAVALRDLLPVSYVRLVLTQARLTEKEIEEFLHEFARSS